MAAPRTKHPSIILPSESSSAPTAGCAVALRALLVLQAQTENLRQCAMELEAAHGTDDYELATKATGGARDAMGQLALAYKRLRTHVIPFDGPVFGDAIESFGELAIRTEMFVVAVQLCRLREQLRPTHQGGHRIVRAQNLFAGRFGNIDEVGAFVRLQFDRINTQWVPHRKASQQPIRAATLRRAPDDRATLYRSAIVAAQRALTALLDEENLGPFLRAGIQDAGPGDVQLACQMITIALQVKLAVEPDLSLLPAT